MNLILILMIYMTIFTLNYYLQYQCLCLLLCVPVFIMIYRTIQLLILIPSVFNLNTIKFALNMKKKKELHIEFYL